MVDGVHALADGVGQLELAQDGRQQDVHVLLGESENSRRKLAYVTRVAYRHSEWKGIA